MRGGRNLLTPRKKRRKQSVANQPMELALAIEQLDIVIGVDSPAVHLGGALGKPAWVLLGPMSHWYWPAASERSPWYPTVRIFHQPKAGDEAGRAERARSAFSAWLQQRAVSSCMAT